MEVNKYLLQLVVNKIIISYQKMQINTTLRYDLHHVLWQ